MFSKKSTKKVAGKARDKDGASVTGASSSSSSSSPAPSNLESYRIPYDELKFEKQRLGAGGFGTVKKGRYNEAPVAVKFLNKTKHNAAEFQAEVATLSALHHPNIVQLLGFCETEDKYLLVMELVEGGDLDKLIHGKKLGNDLLFALLLSLTKGMIFLHKRNVLHRDLKPGNVLIQTPVIKGEVKITDFGLSKFNREDLSQTAHHGTPLYAAPELHSDNYDNKVDVYSFAIMVWEMWSGKQPFSEIKFAHEVVNSVRKGKRPSPWPETMPKALCKMITKCWEGTPKKRPDFETIYAEVQRIKEDLGIGAPTAASLPGGCDDSQLQASSSSSVTSGGVRVASSESSPRSTNTGVTPASQVQLAPTPVVAAAAAAPAPASVAVSAAPAGAAAPAPAAAGGGNTPHDRIATWVAQNAGQLAWPALSAQLKAQLQCDEFHLRRIGYLFQDDTEARVAQLLDWFGPLQPEDQEDDYVTEAVAGAGGGGDPTLWKVSELAEVLGAPWFHGYISAAESKNMLKPLPEGTWIFRFSRNKPYFAFDVVDAGQIVRHWRVLIVAKNLYKINDDCYDSISSIIDTHKKQPPVGASVCLASHCIRQ